MRRRALAARLSTTLLVSIAMIAAIATIAAITAAAPSPAAPDLEITALQSAGPGRIGDCNSVVARLHNRGTAATAEAPSLRLDITGPASWTHTATAKAPLAPGETVEVWFERVPLPAGLSRLQAIGDPEDRVAEADETNNTRSVPRDPQAECGAPDPPPPAGTALRVQVSATTVAGGPTTPLAGATVEVTSPLRAGTVLAGGVTAADGVAALDIPFDSRTPVLRVTATSPGCAPGVQLATPTGAAAALAGSVPPATAGAAPIELSIDLRCSEPGASAATAAKPGTLAIETALPGQLQIDDRLPASVTFGSRVEVEGPGARVRVRETSANGTTFFDQTFDVPRDAPMSVVIDAPALRPDDRDRGKDGNDGNDVAVIEDLRTGLLWTVGAATTESQSAAAAICDALVRDGAGDWRLPEIDELVFVLEAHLRTPAPFAGLSDCCLWSSTEHADGRLTFYLDGGHIYGRHADEGEVGALCVRGVSYPVDPMLVPPRYHDRLPGSRRFRPHD